MPPPARRLEEILEALTRVYVSRDALVHNLELFRLLAGHDRHVMPVVKSNAYGHGLVQVLGALGDSNVSWYGVNSLEEGLALRGHLPNVRVLVMGFVDPDRYDDVLAHDLDVVVTTAAELDRLAEAAGAAGTRARAHLKVETGTHRRGAMPSTFTDVAAAITRHPDRLEPVGLTTHFANIEDTLEHDYADSQKRAFTAAEKELSALGVRFASRHIACTAAALLFPETHLEMVRVGIGLYGLWPSRETLLSYRTERDHPIELRPALRWVTTVTEVKDVPAGAFIGYGRTYRTSVPSRIAILPIGYYEGYDRGLSGRAHVLVRGERAPVRGRVCMNMCMIDVTHIPDARVGDEACLLGVQGDEEIRADDLARWCDTINYEVVTRIPAHLPRILS